MSRVETLANMKFPLVILSLFLLVAGTLAQGRSVFENIGQVMALLHYGYIKLERLKPFMEKLKHSLIKAADCTTIYQTFLSLMF